MALIVYVDMYKKIAYVDNVLITGSCEAEIFQVKQFLDSIFVIKDLGYAKYFLGIKITRSAKGMLLCQRKYIGDC